jgi:hypothetical protein
LLPTATASCDMRIKGLPPKGGNYLVCDRSGRGLGCERTAWRYDQFEASFLAFVSELDLEHIVRDDKNFMNLENEIAALRGKLASINDQIGWNSVNSDFNATASLSFWRMLSSNCSCCLARSFRFFPTKSAALPAWANNSYVRVGFKDGIVQGVFPSDDDPLDFEQVIIR